MNDQNVLGVFEETGADMVTRYVICEPLLSFIRSVNEELDRAIAWYSLKDPTKLTFVIAGFNTMIDVATNQIPLIAKNALLKKIKKEVLGQLPRAIIAHYNQHQNEYVFEEGYVPKFTTQDQFVTAMRSSAVGNLGGLGARIMEGFKDLPHKVMGRVSKKGQKPFPLEFLRDLHFAAVELLDAEDKTKWSAFVGGLNARGQEILREILPTLITTEAIKLVLSTPDEQRVAFMQAYCREGPLEDFWQGIRTSVEGPMDTAIVALDSAINNLD